MAIHFSAPRTTELKPRIVVFGVGGAGGNAVNNMIEAGLEGVEFVVANTDAQQLAFAKTDKRIQLGMSTTQGLGAGAHPEVGMTAAEESASDIGDQLDGVHMIFITAGMGGGTGTGAAPIIAKCARERGILTVGVVTKPFHFEGRHRMRLADAGIAELQRYVDTLIVIPNQNLFRLANEKTTFAEAFGMADQVLHSGVRSITDLMVLPGLINLDFADVRTVMTEMGKAMMGTGEAQGEDRALMAANNAIQNPLLDEVSLKGAKAVLVNVTGGPDMTLLEVDEACNAISDQVDPDANTIFGAAFDPSLQGKIRVSVVATGMDGAMIAMTDPRPVRAVTQIAKPIELRPEPAPAPEPAYEDEMEPMHSMFETPAATVASTPEPMTASLAMIEDDQEEDEAPSYTRELTLDIPEPVRAVEPEIRPITKIVDPMVEDDEPPLFTTTNRDPAPKNGRFFSLFGGRRAYEPDATPSQPQSRTPTAPQPQARQPEPAPVEMEAADDEDDLEIPSFLRRLAN
jgi:cell division protein FtsZ